MSSAVIISLSRLSSPFPLPSKPMNQNYIQEHQIVCSIYSFSCQYLKLGCVLVDFALTGCY